MAGFVLKDVYALINTVNMSAYIQDISFNLDMSTVDSTAMGDDSLESLPAMKSGGVTITLKQENTDSGLNEDLWDIYNGAAAVAIVLKSNGDTTGATNPSFTGSCIMTSWSPIDGTVGDLAKAPTTFILTGDVTRAES